MFLSTQRYGSFVFTPGDLMEEVDLDVERRKEILFTHAQIGKWTLWELLGVPWNADAAAVRRAYLEKVKVFHPDRYGGKNLGKYRGRIEQVFKALTEASNLLSDEAKRAAYAEKTAPPEEKARLEARKLEDEIRADERRARLARQNPLLARAARVNDLLKRGKDQLAAGRYREAANDFLTVQSLDPRHAEALKLAAEAKRLGDAARSEEAFERGEQAYTLGNVSEAHGAYRQAAAADPSNTRYASKAAMTALELGLPDEARAVAEAAVKAGPRNAKALTLLGEVLAAQEQPREARRAFERALEISPDLEAARAGLKKLSRWNIFGR